ncbi:hypothetical protein F5Y08DRAFT_636 [Xylaria arbuscula]|nr:hypothetical protein F5Y08DRAFT_636 [Xylaria arbuscula]
MALGSSKTFYECKSGTFYNLYDRTWAEQCEPVSLIAIPCGSDNSAEQSPDGQIVGTTVVQTTIVTALTDGQPQVITTSLSIPVYSTYVPVSEYTDGQIQVTPSATGSVSVPITYETPTATSTAVPSTETTPVATPTTSAASTPATSVGSSSSAASSSVESSSSSPVTTPASSTSSAASSTSSAPATTSAPSTGGSSHVAAGSMGALVVGAVVAFLCL